NRCHEAIRGGRRDQPRGRLGHRIRHRSLPLRHRQAEDLGARGWGSEQDRHRAVAVPLAARRRLLRQRAAWCRVDRQGRGRYADIGVLARTFDQDEWRHAFGVSGLYMPVQGLTAGPSDLAFQWYWGPNAGAYSQPVVTELEQLYAGIHMAGPKLTPQTFTAGVFSR